MATQRYRVSEDASSEDSAPLDAGEIGEASYNAHTSDPEGDPQFTDKLSLRERFNKDRRNVLLLLLLYCLQGIPIGLSASIPIILQEKKIGYRQQALFSLVTWPFTIKLVWAPIVDSIYSSRFGRRKSWLIPSQLGIGITMVSLSFFINGLMGDGSSSPNVVLLTVVFFFLHFLAATQDIAVDAWALTILSKGNVGLMSTCNSVGQTAGFFISYTILLAFNSADFCNRFIRTIPQKTGILDFPSFLLYFGLLFVLVTTMVWWFKKEKNEEKEHSKADRNILSGYMRLLGIFKLPAVQTYALAILTSKVSREKGFKVGRFKILYDCPMSNLGGHLESGTLLMARWPGKGHEYH